MSYLNSDAGRAQLLGRAKTSSGLHSINSRLIAGLLIPLPLLAEQRTIAEVLRACDEKIAALEREAAAHDELFKALLEELMTGRLRAAALVEQA
jgi:type I restriction enzyme S subunit